MISLREFETSIDLDLAKKREIEFHFREESVRCFAKKKA